MRTHMHAHTHSHAHAYTPGGELMFQYRRVAICSILNCMDRNIIWIKELYLFLPYWSLSLVVCINSPLLSVFYTCIFLWPSTFLFQVCLSVFLSFLLFPPIPLLPLLKYNRDVNTVSFILNEPVTTVAYNATLVLAE